LPRASDQSSGSFMSERFGADDAPLVRCPSCGGANPASHKFCGKCGATLPEEDEAAHSDRGSDASGPESAASTGEGVRSAPQPFEHSITNPDELSLFRSFRPADSSDSDDWEIESGVRRYRVYIGLLLVIVLGGLGFAAWRASKNSPQGSREEPPPPPTATQEAPQQATPTKPPSTKVPEKKPSVERPETSTPSAAKKANAAPPTSSAAPSAEAPPSAAVDNGSEELDMARHYLNPSNGRTRDSAEAAKWLWKSIAKHNSEATVLLADLYMKGDGVSKNCDQARVLLDSAARKGLSSAAERLRNLQAFGCQ